MRLFVISIISAYLAMNFAGAINATDIWSVMIIFSGFMLPYAIVLEKLYKEKAKD